MQVGIDHKLASIQHLIWHGYNTLYLLAFTFDYYHFIYLVHIFVFINKISTNNIHNHIFITSRYAVRKDKYSYFITRDEYYNIITNVNKCFFKEKKLLQKWFNNRIFVLKF